MVAWKQKLTITIDKRIITSVQHNIEIGKVKNVSDGIEKLCFDSLSCDVDNIIARIIKGLK